MDISLTGVYFIDWIADSLSFDIFFIGTMDSAAYIKKSKQANPLTLQVLKLPAKNSLI